MTKTMRVIWSVVRLFGMKSKFLCYKKIFRKKDLKKKSNNEIPDFRGKNFRKHLLKFRKNIKKAKDMDSADTNFPISHYKLDSITRLFKNFYGAK